MAENNNQSWESWSNYVLKTLEKVEERVDYLEEQINDNNLKSQTDIVELKVKAAFIATIASIVVSVIMSIIAGVVVSHMKDNPPPPPTEKSDISFHYTIETLPQPKYYVEVPTNVRLLS